MNAKPLDHPIYGSIPHLPQSRLGPSDKQASIGHVRIATEKPRDKCDLIIVSEKIDGSNVGVAKLPDSSLVPLIRSGYVADTSPYLQHRYWASWVYEHSHRFNSLLSNGEWCVGEWCIQAHGTKYTFLDEPFFLFDIFSTDKRITKLQLDLRNNSLLKPFCCPRVFFCANSALPVCEASAVLGDHGFHGALDKAEGAVWRVERNGMVDFLCKYVRPQKYDGIYLPEIAGTHYIVWNEWGSDCQSLKHLLR